MCELGWHGCVVILGPFSDEEEVKVEEIEAKCLSGSEVEGAKDGDVEMKDIDSELDEVKESQLIWLCGMSNACICAGKGG